MMTEERYKVTSTQAVRHYVESLAENPVITDADLDELPNWLAAYYEPGNEEGEHQLNENWRRTVAPRSSKPAVPDEKVQMLRVISLAELHKLGPAIFRANQLLDIIEQLGLELAPTSPPVAQSPDRDANQGRPGWPYRPYYSLRDRMTPEALERVDKHYDETWNS